MFIGHLALGFAAKRWAPRLSLGTMLAAPIMCDGVGAVLGLVGLEHSEVVVGATAVTPLIMEIPWSHSLAMTLLFGVVFGGALRAMGHAASTSLIGSTLVASHWPLDWLMHRPDMELWPGGVPFGLGLWNSVPGTLVTEIGLFAGGVWLYARATRASDLFGHRALVGLVAFLLLAYLGTVFGPPPPSGRSVSAGTLGLAVVVAWGAWIDRHRACILG
jgi:hypothetical protein